MIHRALAAAQGAAKRFDRPVVMAQGRRRPRAARPAGLTSLRFIGDALRRRVWVWCGAAIAGLVISAGLYVIAPPAYQAQTSILVTNDANEDPQTQVLGDIEIAQNAQVAKGAIDELGSRQSVGGFLASYSVTAASNRVLQITARAGSADAAVREASAIATVFLKLRAQELTTQQQVGVAALVPLIASHKRHYKSLTAKIARVTSEPHTRARKTELRRLAKESRKATISLGVLEYNLTNYPVLTQSMVQGTRVLDAAAPIPPSRRHMVILFTVAGLICGLGLGLSIVAVSALMPDRPHGRRDVARLLRSAVRGVGRQPLPCMPHSPPAAFGRRLPSSLVATLLRRQSRRHRGLRLAGPWTRRGEVRLLADRLREAVPDRRPAALAVVAVDSLRPAATALAALAASCAQDGRRVVLADLSGSARAARVLGVREPGTCKIEASGAHLVVTVPEPGEIGPVSGSGIASLASEPFDLLLSLATLDIAVGADQLATWATDVAVVVTAGRSAPATIHAVGEMVRLAGLRLAFGVLLRTDKADESCGLTPSRVGWHQPSRVRADPV